MPLIALYDSCVLYPAPLRDLLMQLAVEGLFQARWSNRIHDEWIAAVLRDRPDIKRRQLEHTRRLMNKHARDCLVENFETLIPKLELPDANDRHVLAAAIHCRADVIVTFNLKDFPSRFLAAYSIIAQHPDDFLADLAYSAPQILCLAARTVRARLVDPPYSVDDYLARLSRQNIPKTVAFLRKNRQFI